mmetsp:Transcript_20649/g.31497  ORF Transcript_20649/g.31497 Transcript_20649/m.31497 type:complete len:151 (-) Transcript_20649:3621-4073(-)
MYHLSVCQQRRKESGVFSSVQDCHDLDRASLYNDGAIISTKKREKTVQSSQEQGPKGLLSKGDVQIDLAINFNNRSVIELKRNNFEGAKESAMSVIKLIEPKVYGFINSGLVPEPNAHTGQHLKDRHFLLFQELLQILLIGYFNLGMSQD